MMQHKRRRFLRLISLSITAVILISVLIASACAEPNAETIAPETQTASVEQPTAQAAEPAPAPSTEAPAVPLTEAPTVPSTEPATEPATEPPTEPPTEPETEAPTTEPASDDPETPRGMFRFAPDGTLTLIDDFEYLGMDADGNTMSKQFITVQSRDGSYFYIIIDRTGESENVYFLNQVDLADLKTLAGNGVQQIPDSSCTCKTHCSVGHIDLTCPICSANMTECAAADSTKEGQTPSSDEDSEPGEKTAEQNTPESNAKKQKQQSAVLVLFVALIAVGVFYFWKRKKKGGKSSKKKASPEFEFDDEDEDDDELEVEFTPQEEPGRTERLKPFESPVAPAGEADAEEENDFEDEGDLM